MNERIIIFFPKYTKSGPSSRYRTYQYINYYKEAGITCKLYPLFNDRYINELYTSRRVSLINLLYSIIRRIIIVLCIKKRSVIFIEYELLPYFPVFLEWYIRKVKKVKYILDYDDAIFHNYDRHNSVIIRFLLKNKISYIVKYADFIVTGSPYLTNYMLNYNAKCIEIPTSINLDNYKYCTVNKNDFKNVVFTIGWIGSKTTSINLINILPSIRALGKSTDYKLALIGFDTNLISYLDGINYEIIRWDQNTEVSEINKFDVGIMPLDDTDFNKGKCGFKLIQYMACAKITVSTPTETNISINKNNDNLYAISVDDWLKSFLKINYNYSKYVECGINNYNIIKSYYSVQSNYSKYISLFNSILQNRNINI